MSTLGRNLRTGIGIGVFFATGFTAYVTVLRLVSGTAPFERLGTTYLMTVTTYYVGFSTGGALVGILLPLRRHRLGSILLGSLGLFPVYLGVLTQLLPRTEWFRDYYLLGAVFVSLAVGGSLGLYAWKQEYGKIGP